MWGKRMPLTRAEALLRLNRLGEGKRRGTDTQPLVRMPPTVPVPLPTAALNPERDQTQNDPQAIPGAKKICAQQ